MNLLFSWLVSALAILSTAYLLQKGVHVDNFLTALVIAVVLGIINAILRPILIVLTLPINIITLGLFTFVINALLIMFTSYLVTGFRVDSFWWALLFSLVLSIINSFLHKIAK
jgi:putative membrane protein